MARSEWEFRLAHQRTAENADQTEYKAIKSGPCPIDEGTRDDRIADALDDFGALDESDNARYVVEDSKVDDAGGAIGDEILRRAQLMGDAYPFIVDGNSLVYRQSKTLAYELCLAILNAPSITAKPFNALPVAFERLGRDVVKCFFGFGAEAIRTGWPRDGEPHLTARFRSVVDRVASLTNEWVWRPTLGKPSDPDPKDVKDLGIDFVVWKKMPDGRRGIFLALAQCACGDDWTDKFDDLKPGRIREEWFERFCFAEPLRLFLVPHHIPNDPYFAEVNSKAGLTLDRARIVMIAENEANRDAVARGANTPLADLVKLVVDGFGVAQPVRAPRRRKAVAARHSRSRGRAARGSQP